MDEKENTSIAREVSYETAKVGIEHHVPLSEAWCMLTALTTNVSAASFDGPGANDQTNTLEIWYCN